MVNLVMLWSKRMPGINFLIYKLKQLIYLFVSGHQDKFKGTEKYVNINSYNVIDNYRFKNQG